MPKPRKCKICTAEYTPFSSMEKACSFVCAAELARQVQIKKRKKENAEYRREFLANDKGHQLKKAEEWCNKYIRLRDAGKPCISCDATNYTMTAGHYMSAGNNPALRYDELNIHGQCWWNCNSNKSGNLIEYRKRLIVRIGIEKVEWLEGHHELPNYTLDDLKQIQKHYREKCAQLKDKAA